MPVRHTVESRTDTKARGAWFGTNHRGSSSVPRWNATCKAQRVGTTIRRKVNILLVENHSTFARVVTDQFLGEYKVTIVGSIAAARTAVERDATYEYVLVDYDLDDGKGDELVRAVRTTSPDSAVVGISAHDRGNQQLLAAGASAACSKADFKRIAELLDQLHPTAAKIPTEDAIVGAILGGFIGDAVGSVFEGAAQSRALAEQVARRVARPAHWGYTDDTEMGLGVAESLLARGYVDPDHLVHTLSRNCDVARGYGRGTRRVLESPNSWREARYASWPSGSKGNGAAARVTAVACAEAGVDALTDAAVTSATITHAHPEAYVGAALMATAIAQALAADSVESAAFLERLRDTTELLPCYTRKLLAVQEFAQADVGGREIAATLGTGVLAIESVPAAVCIFLRNVDSFERTIIEAVSLGGDTDTIGAMAGALAGAFHGASAIPPSWLDALEAGPRGHEFARHVAIKLHLQRTSPERRRPELQRGN